MAGDKIKRVIVVMAGLCAATGAAAQPAAPQSGSKSSQFSGPPIAGPVTSPASAQAFAGTACADAYYRALEPLRTGRGAVLAGLHRALRTPDPELPGKWQVTAPPSGKPKPPPKAERICVETKEIPGRAPRCLRFETKPPVVPLEVVARLPATPDETRLLKPISDMIEAKGALPDVGNNGRHNFLVQRIAQDIRLYASQPPHPNLCAGSADLIEFYAGQLAPLKKRMDEVTVLAKQAKDLAAGRVRAIAVTEMKIYDKAVADAARITEQNAKLLEAYKVALAKAQDAEANALPSAPLRQPPAAPTLPASPTVPPRPDAPANLADYAIVSWSSLLAETLRPLLPQTKIAEISDEQVQVKGLVKARAALLDPDTPASTAATEVKDAAMMALRILEARAYSDLYVARFKELDAALFGAMTDLRKAQASSCTCRE